MQVLHAHRSTLGQAALALAAHDGALVGERPARNS
jgi:hypothetical protein